MKKMNALDLILVAPLCVTLASCIMLDEGKEESAGDRGTGATTEALSVTPNDPHYAKQTWNYNAIHLPAAWAITTGSTSTLIAVIDSGSQNHPDLNAKWYGGWDFFSGDSNPDDAFPSNNYHHGIHVAGILGAVSNNGTGVTGVCWGCRLMPIRASSEKANVGDPGNSPDNVAAIARAIQYASGYAVDSADTHHTLATPPQAADVINISLGNRASTTCPSVIQSAINQANAAGVTVVVAAADIVDGGTHDVTRFLWGTCQGVILVTAVDAAGNAEPYSALGPSVTLAAPGGAAVNGLPGSGALVGCPDDPSGGTGGVFSTWATNLTNVQCYRYWAGTSMATPHVTGVVALMRSQNPSLPPAQIKQILQKTAQPIPCPTSQCGAGMLDAAAAVQAAQFAGSASCQSMGGGTFTCTPGITGGVAPVTASWQGVANASVGVPGMFGLVHGTCSVNHPSSVKVTLTDAIGRVVTSTTSFTCTQLPQPQ